MYLRKYMGRRQAMKKSTLVLTHALRRGKDLEHAPDEMFALSQQNKNSSIF